MNNLMINTGYEWSKQDDRVLIDSVLGADSVKQGLTKASKMLALTFYTCRNRWYKYIVPNGLHKTVELKEHSSIAEPEPDPTPVEEKGPVEAIKGTLGNLLGDLTNLVETERALRVENKELREENARLRKEMEEYQDDRAFLARIMNEARRIGTREGTEPQADPRRTG